MRLRSIFSSSLVVLGLSAPLMADSWPQFRGPTGDGIAKDTIPEEWSETTNVAWKTPIPGRGWSTPVVHQGKIWLTTATEDGKEMSMYCLDEKSGKILHQEVAYKNDKPEPLGNPVNGYASPSALVEDGRVYIHFGSYGTRCLDTVSYKTLWDRTDLPCRHYRGPGSSLAAHGDKLILTMDGVDVQYLAALDKKTGKTVWKTDRTANWDDLDASGKPKMEGDMRKAYTTPFFVKFSDGTEQMISTGSKATNGYDPKTGKELWRITYAGFSNASSAYYYGGTVFVNTGYGKANIMAIPLEANSRDDLTSKAVWTQSKRMPLRSSPIAVDSLLYVVADDGHMSALDMKTGDPVWSERLQSNFSASLILVNGKILACGEHGSSFWIQPGREFKLVGTNTLDSGALASPAVASGALILRTKTHVYSIRKS